MAKAAHYPHVTRIPDLENQHDEPDQPKHLTNCSLYHCRAILEVSSKSAHSLLNNGQISNGTINMVIWIGPRI